MNTSSNAIEWCSLRQAVQWIAHGTVPRSPEYEDAFAVQTTIWPEGNALEREAEAQLRCAILEGHIGLVGQRGIGETAFSPNNYSRTFYVSRYADYAPVAPIPVEDIKTARAEGIDTASDSVWAITEWLWISDNGAGLVSGAAAPAAGWGYGNVRLLVAELLQEFPKPELSAAPSANVEPLPKGMEPGDQDTGHTTELLAILEKIRAQMSVDEDTKRWTRDAIKARVHEISPERSDRDQGAIATLLLPDAARKKNGVPPKKQ